MQLKSRRYQGYFWLCSFLFLALSLSCVRPTSTTSSSDELIWQDWSKEVFGKAQKENRLILLHLGAVWCHWCHVMEETTYQNQEVISLLANSFLTIYVDQDTRPDLASRYSDYGWPATILFNSKGEEIAKLSGYIPPPRMIALLKAFIKDPTPGPSIQNETKVEYGTQTVLSQELAQELHDIYLEGYDKEHKGWGRIHKFLNGELIEYAVLLARQGDQEAKMMAQDTLDAQLALFDPAWGGVYQYSDSGVWTNPHFEKIMFMQVDNLRAYAKASILWPSNKTYLEAAENVYRYLNGFLKSEDGSFYTSQDADVIKGEHSEEYFALNNQERRDIGIPKVDKNRYSRENGWVISALVDFYLANKQEKVLEEAILAARWVQENRSLSDDGFSHGKEDKAGPFLDDNLAMGQAFLALYMATANPEWLQNATGVADFIWKHFTTENKATSPGYIQSDPSNNPVSLRQKPTVEENIVVARFLNLLYHYTQNPKYRSMAEHAMRFLATPEIAKSRIGKSAGILLANKEFSSEPLRITVIGSKDDAEAKELFQEAGRYPNSYKRVEWWDPKEGSPPLPDEMFGVISNRASIIICLGKDCSSASFDKEDIFKEADQLLDIKASLLHVP